MLRSSQIDVRILTRSTWHYESCLVLHGKDYVRISRTYPVLILLRSGLFSVHLWELSRAKAHIIFSQMVPVEQSKQHGPLWSSNKTFLMSESVSTRLGLLGVFSTSSLMNVKSMHSTLKPQHSLELQNSSCLCRRLPRTQLSATMMRYQWGMAHLGTQSVVI